MEIRVSDRQVVREVETAMRTTRETVVMGDFWPGNVLISLAQKPAAGADGPGVGIAKAYVIDWELVKAGLAGGGTLHFVSPQNSEQILAVGLWFGPGKKMFAT